MFTDCKNKIQDFGVGTLVSQQQKNVFRDDLSRPDLELVWNKMQIQETETLVGNIYIPPGYENHLHKLDMELEKQRKSHFTYWRFQLQKYTVGQTH